MLIPSYYHFRMTLWHDSFSYEMTHFHVVWRFPMWRHSYTVRVVVWRRSHRVAPIIPGWRRPIGFLICISHILQKSLIIYSLLQKMTCNLGHPMDLCHPVPTLRLLPPCLKVHFSNESSTSQSSTSQSHRNASSWDVTVTTVMSHCRHRHTVTVILWHYNQRVAPI